MDTNVENFLAEMEIEDTVELTPLIDVIFQLLVFFMLTSTFMLPTIDLSLPRLGGETQVVDRKDIPRLEVDSSGQIRLNGQPINCLINDLKDGILENDVRLFIDEATPYSSIASILKDLASIGVGNIQFVYEEK